MADFTRDCPGCEVEVKFNIELTKDLSFSQLFNKFLKSFEENGIDSFFRLMDLGTQPTKVSDWKYTISYHGVCNEHGSNKQIYMLVHSLFDIVVFPNIKVFSLNGVNNKTVSYPLVRYEDKSYSKKMLYWQYLRLHRQLESQYGSIVEFGRLVRYKKWFYIQNHKSKRNYAFAMDECVSVSGRRLLQLEIEYKGRAGKHTPEGTKPVCDELIILADILINRQPELSLTGLTKAEWLLGT